MIHSWRSACCALAGILFGACAVVNAYWGMAATFLLLVPWRFCIRETGEWLYELAEWHRRRAEVDELSLIERT